MLSRERLREKALRAYELGRLVTPAKVAWLLVPTALVCALETRASETCLCLSVGLLGLAVFLRWRDRRGEEFVRYGLLAGLAPLFVALTVARVAPSCVGAPLFSWCTAFCAGVGLPSGAWLGVRLARGGSSFSTWLLPCTIAILAASLGCVGLGMGGIAGTAVGLFLGAAAMLTARVFPSSS